MEAAERLAGVRLIVVHGGLAHMDDIMSCAIAYAFGVPHDAPIERRNPTPAELDAENVLVMDVGGVHDSARLDFDHHQRAADDEPKCAFRLLAEWLGADAELRTLCPWYTAWNYIDVCGTARTAAMFGAPPDALAGLVANPLSDWVIRRFADDPVLRRKLSLSLANELDLTRRCWRSIGPKIVERAIAGLLVADLTCCLTAEISRCSSAWARLHHPACLLMRDSRGEGYSLLRCADDPRIDFSRCAGRPYALFAHPGGFILKTRTKDVDLEAVLADALVDVVKA
jgi:hypothetical protein